MAENEKPKLAMYWAASCGGCEIAVLNIHEKILDVDAAMDIAFWPVAVDYKYKDVEGYPDGYIDVCLFNGAIRTEENESIAKLLRKKSKFLVAFGSCAYEGGIPALGNLTNNAAIFKTVYQDSISVDNPQGLLPAPIFKVPEGEIHIPEFYERVRSLDQVVDVDYFIPGCPPEPHQIWAVIQVVLDALQKGAPLPPKGSIVGALDVAVCSECKLQKNEKKISRFFRPYEINPKPDLCLLEQGLVCMGPSTRGGCGALCPQVGMGCRGCYGPLSDVPDQGARMIAALASILDVGLPKDDEFDLEERIVEALDTLADPEGTFYRYSLPHSLLKQRRYAGNGFGKGEPL